MSEENISNGANVSYAGNGLISITYNRMFCYVLGR